MITIQYQTKDSDWIEADNETVVKYLNELETLKEKRIFGIVNKELLKKLLPKAAAIEISFTFEYN